MALPHPAADALALRGTEHLRLLQLDAGSAERTRGRHRVDGPAVDDHVDLGEPAGIGQDGCYERPEGYSRADFDAAMPPWSGGSAYAPPELRLL